MRFAGGPAKGYPAVGQLLLGWAAMYVLGRVIDEVLLAEAALELGARRLRFRQRHGDAGVLAGLDLMAFVVAAIGDDFELFSSHFRARFLSHAGELLAVGADVGHVVRDDKMVRRVDGGLHVVADDAGVFARQFGGPFLSESLPVRLGSFWAIPKMQPSPASIKALQNHKLWGSSRIYGSGGPTRAPGHRGFGRVAQYFQPQV